MTESHDAQPKRRWRQAYHLIWALPIALVASAFPLFMSTLFWCGINGCSGGGYGTISDPDIAVAVLWLIASGVVAAIPLAAVPWTQNKPTRFWVAVLFAVIISAIGYGMIGP